MLWNEQANRGMRMSERERGRSDAVRPRPARVALLAWWSKRSPLAALACLLVATLVQPAPCAAQAAEPTAEERQAAADAYDRGTRAYLAEDFARAAQWFETAHRMAPASAALVQAVRSYERAGETRRAATLALRLAALYPDDAGAAQQAERTLASASEFVLVNVVCETSCSVELDGTLMEHPSFYVDPSSAHEVRATFETGPVTQSFDAGDAGSTRSLDFSAPEAQVVVDEPPPPETTPSEGSGGLSPAVAITGLVLTAGAGGVLIWSGVDALDGVPAYEAMPTDERLAEGQTRELRTNILIGVTAGLGAATVILMVFTDWDGDGESSATDDDEPVAVSVVPTQGGGALLLSGAF